MRRRILLVVVATTSLVVIAFAVPLAGLVREVAHDRAITAAERDAAALAPVLALTTDREQVAASVERTATGGDGRMTVWLPDGTPVGDATPADPDATALARDGRASFSRETDDGIELWSPVVTGAGQVSLIRARVPGDLLNDGVTTAWVALGAIAVVLVAAAVLIADRLARSLTSDATALAATARTLAGGDPTARVAPAPTPELADAGHALNLLADRIGELRTAERERVADLSHRLRTPLTAVRLEAEAAGNPGMTTAVDRLEGAVTELVKAARRPLHDSPVPARCDLAGVVRERSAFWSALADDDGRPWTASIPDAEVPVAADADEVAAAVDALIGNVFTHTPEGTPYAVTVEGDGTLVVEDAGPGIDNPGAVVARGVTGGGSSGLGLDIARQAGTGLQIGRSELGGARVVLRFSS